jgi:hypothetical protein
MLFTPTLSDLLKTMERKNYLVYSGDKSTDRTLNIVGIRRKTASPDKFDDTLALFHLLNGAEDLVMFPITTDPSPHYLRRPVNIKGTAILKEGQYANAYKISQHSPPSGNKHQAICQRLGKVTVYRDNTKDGKLNFVNPEEGMFGINIHRGPRDGDWDTESPNYSAGCQVFADEEDFSFFMARCKEEAAEAGGEFTYTLLNESDFA